jgi:hypothetical protein
MRSTSVTAFNFQLALVLAARAVGAVQQRWRRYVEVRARERAVREIVLALRGMNAHTLRDVGLDVSRVYLFAPEAADRGEAARERLTRRATQCSS